MTFFGEYWSENSFYFDLVFCGRKNSSGVDDKVVPAGERVMGDGNIKNEQKGTFWRKNHFRNFAILISTQNEKNTFIAIILNKFSLRCLEIRTNYATGCCFFEVSVQIWRRLSTRFNIRAKHNSKKIHCSSTNTRTPVSTKHHLILLTTLSPTITLHNFAGDPSHPDWRS